MCPEGLEDDLKQCAADQELLYWLLNQFSGKDLWMDGTCHWALPHNVLSGIRAPTALDAILLAKRRYDAWAASDAPSKDRS